ncbi:MAG: PqqD family protein [Clostridia bacterium]|nr:PqqD family protein [Clostridia bacterium]
MKIKEGFVLRRVMGKAVVIAAGNAGETFHGMIKLNDTAADVWQWLSEGCDIAQIVQKITEKYDVSAEKATADVHTLLDKLRAEGIVE